jgi:hypothetical protein
VRRPGQEEEETRGVLKPAGDLCTCPDQVQVFDDSDLQRKGCCCNPTSKSHTSSSWSVLTWNHPGKGILGINLEVSSINQHSIQGLSPSVPISRGQEDKEKTK